MAEVEIDDSLYSRQRYVLGDVAMKRMAASSVLVYGMGGLGIEIAKNIVLAGVKSITVQDGKQATVTDLGTQFFLRADDVKNNRNRAEASAVRLAELNPYVTINTLTTGLDDGSDLSYLQDYQCLIFTEIPMSLQIKINKFCRQQNPQIKFISSDVYGIFSSTFCDFGDQFEVTDTNGEEPKDILLESVTKGNPGVVTCLQSNMHGLDTGDHVTFKEIKGMTALNGNTYPVKVLTPYQFQICDTSGGQFAPYEHGGIATQVKVPVSFAYKSVESQLLDPSLIIPDLGKFGAPANIHLGFLALHKFIEVNSRLPNVGCQNDASQLVVIANEFNQKLVSKVDSIDEDLIKALSYTCQGCFAPLCAAVGGFVAQEGLKALTGKFTPLNQWLYMDCTEVLKKEDIPNSALFQPRNDRYDALRICVGQNMCQKLAELRLFMVGCGAIGCEMLKNYALLGIGSQGSGLITITDNDLIEKSNLNRQFLFRPQHIRHPKSTTAAQSVLEINPGLKIEAQQHKVCPQTQAKVYHDAFFESQTVVVNALDNVEARRYVDSRCVTNQRPLLESGTMGTKGHVQVIVPHMTESYSSQRDPVDHDVPYCTLKSFPANIEHCIQWARDKFESSFAMKPELFNKFWSSNRDPQYVVQVLRKDEPIDGAVQVSKLLQNRASGWSDCVRIARLKFEKYFNHKAKNLLHHFPLDTKLQDGSLFWQSPKRTPVQQKFNTADPNHMLFVISTARLYADIFRLPVLPQETSEENVLRILESVKVPDYIPSSKTIVTDESAAKPVEEDTGSGDELVDAGNRIQIAVQSAADAKQKSNIRQRRRRKERLQKIPKSQKASQVLSAMSRAEFEKDDDSNGHIDFITASANLRGAMYSIESADRLKVKRIAGRIIPAIATTTAAVSGLVSVELVKLLEKLPIEAYKNCFLNLALPVMVLSEPGAVEKTVIKEGLTVTMWDKWEVHGTQDFTLQQFLHYFKDVYGFEATMVTHGVKIVYIPFMPAHSKRLPQTMVKLLKPQPGQKYMDLVIALQGDDEEDVECPPIRYFFE